MTKTWLEASREPNMETQATGKPAGQVSSGKLPHHGLPFLYLKLAALLPANMRLKLQVNPYAKLCAHCGNNVCKVMHTKSAGTISIAEM